MSQDLREKYTQMYTDFLTKYPGTYDGLTAKEFVNLKARTCELCDAPPPEKGNFLMRIDYTRPMVASNTISACVKCKNLRQSNKREYADLAHFCMDLARSIPAKLEKQLRPAYDFLTPTFAGAQTSLGFMRLKL